MGSYSYFERIVHKLDEKTIPALAHFRRSRLNNTDFTIISNNCWGGLCYEYFGLKKMSPTIGSYFFSEDYIRFIKDLRYYTSLDIEVINAEDSKHSEILYQKNQMNVPIGRIDDVEIVFLHYKDPNLAREKWIRRCERINWNNIIIKYSYMSFCKDEHIYAYNTIKGYKKFVFTPKAYNVDNCIVVPSKDEKDVGNDTFWFRKYIDLYELINTNTYLVSEK